MNLIKIEKKPFAGFFSIMFFASSVSLASLNQLHSLFNGLHVEWNQLVVALRQCFVEGLLQAFRTDDGAHFEERTEHDHVENLGIFQFGGLVHGVDAIGRYVVTLGRIDDAEAVVDERSARFELGHELIQ